MFRATGAREARAAKDWVVGVVSGVWGKGRGGRGAYKEEELFGEEGGVVAPFLVLCRVRGQLCI